MLICASKPRIIRFHSYSRLLDFFIFEKRKESNTGIDGRGKEKEKGEKENPLCTSGEGRKYRGAYQPITVAIDRNQHHKHWNDLFGIICNDRIQTTTMMTTTKKESEEEKEKEEKDDDDDIDNKWEEEDDMEEEDYDEEEEKEEKKKKREKEEEK
ncbi:hypothetical protein PoB_005663900 [Plakobranchus ocellatus]|uniref:Uncharacterized protein n=1 Tax=Plakobranchus ocellatus TaxID=259542 RepID=A0AAV4CH83_9GAST|nr:hypothetical protein PoB_005663900 [Plakobranchus ocellatus]